MFVLGQIFFIVASYTPVASAVLFLALFVGKSGPLFINSVDKLLGLAVHSKTGKRQRVFPSWRQCTCVVT
ncbi:hypothetical protein E2C01_052106 [Portunus trituberculatus]|uniref:Uncharacterized protein n=1 Tax=Portunus trituberculatus TaxID=210409 RepID=A0A5B7GDJ5_PORTR|nr:hypothetical protein [Portunus trituberculatus]